MSLIKKENKWFTIFYYQGNQYKKCWGNISKTKARIKDDKYRYSIEQGERIKIANDLWDARRRYLLLESKIRKLQDVFIELQKKCEAINHHYVSKNQNTHVYPEIPAITFIASKKGEGISEVSGIYFIWEEGAIKYIGKAKNLNKRLRLGSHHILKLGDLISILEFDKKQLRYAESFYIGICRPILNFGLIE